MPDAVYVVEYRGISEGIAALDRMVKAADVTILHAGPICIGKYLIALGGDVGDIRAAEACAHVSQPPKPASNVGSCVLTGTHPDILKYFRRDERRDVFSSVDGEAIAIFETRNIAAGFRGLDQALKSGAVSISNIWMGRFLGGKFCCVLNGTVSDARAALFAVANVTADGEVTGSELIPSPDAATMALLRDKAGGR